MARLNDISPARRAAFEILRQVEQGAFSSTLLAAAELKLQPLDRALAHELVLGVLRQQLFLDRIVEQFTKRKVKSLDAPVRIALRLGLYQLRFLTRIPASAAVNESVSLVRSAKLSSATSFVNALLRRAIREFDYDPAAAIEDPLEKIAVETSHPRWLIERWSNSFGVETTHALARANNEHPPIAFRVINNQTNILDELRSAGADLKPSNIASDAWRITGATQLIRELASSGSIYIQDEASQLVAQSVGVEADDRVLDLCAAPGGKTTLLAASAAEVVAADVALARLQTLKKSIELQRVKNVRMVELDAGEKLPFPSASFDRVLVDAPCSGTGTLRHNPEIRWRLAPEDFKKLAQQQLTFLRNAAEVVRPGGRLVYSTCSVETDENEDVVRKFLASNEKFAAIKTQRTWPQIEGCDGFFMTTFNAKNN